MKATSTERKFRRDIRMIFLHTTEIVFIILLFLGSCKNKSGADLNGQLAGMYKLYIIENRDATGEWRQQDWGKDGDGYIVYDGKGHMAVQITPKGYKDFSWLSEEAAINNDSLKQKIDDMSATDLKAAVVEFSSNYVYVANYSISDSANVVTHYRLSHTNPSLWNTTVKRKFTFKGDTLILEPLNVNRRLKWIKQK
jgi:hypothetical protein